LQSKGSDSENLKDETYKLKGYIKELENANKSLESNLKALERNKISVEDLNQDIEALKNKNQELENQNRFLNENLDAFKREKLKINILETSVLELNREIDNLRKANKELRDKDSILLAHTITAMSSPRKYAPSQEETENSALESEPEPEHERITEINSEVETETSNLGAEIKKEILIEKKDIIADLPLESEQNIIKEDVEEISTETGFENGFTRKWQCPNCGNKNKSQIREQDDKTRVIYSYPKMYAKKYICGQCGKQWR